MTDSGNEAWLEVMRDYLEELAERAEEGDVGGMDVVYAQLRKHVQEGV
jgi:hypothetical protein